MSSTLPGLTALTIKGDYAEYHRPCETFRSKAWRLTTTTNDLLVTHGNTNTTDIDLRGCTLLAIITPSTITAASFTIKHSIDNGATWNTVSLAGTVYTVTLGVAQHVVIDPNVGRSLFGRIKLTLNTAEATEDLPFRIVTNI